MKNDKDVVSKFEDLKRLSFVNEQYFILHHLALLQISIYQDSEEWEKMKWWVEILKETISGDAVDQFRGQLQQLFSMLTESDWRSTLVADVDSIINMNRNVMKSVGGEVNYRTKLANVLSMVNRLGVTERAKLSEMELTQNARKHDFLRFSQIILKSNPKKHKKKLFEMYRDDCFEEIFDLVERVQWNETRKKSVVIGVFEFVSRDFPELNKTMRAKITGYVCGVIGVFDSENDHNKSDRNQNYSVYLANAARNHLRKANVI